MKCELITNTNKKKHKGSSNVAIVVKRPIKSCALNVVGL